MNEFYVMALFRVLVWVCDSYKDAAKMRDRRTFSRCIDYSIAWVVECEARSNPDEIFGKPITGPAKIRPLKGFGHMVF
jgi:hypothetical protein